MNIDEIPNTSGGELGPLPSIAASEKPPVSARLGSRTAFISVLMLSISSLVIIIYAIASSSLAVLFAYFVLFGLGALFAGRFGRSSLQLYINVFALNVLVTVALYALYLNRYDAPYYIGGSDDLAFETAAQEVANKLEPFEYSEIKTVIVRSLHQAVGYVYLISLVHRIAEAIDGFDTMLPRLINSMAMASIAVITYRIGFHLQLSKKIALGTGYIIGLLPIMMFTSAHSFRDVITSVITLWIVFIWARAHNNIKVTSNLMLLGQTLLGVLILSQFRWYQAVATALIALVAGFASQVKYSRRSILIFILVVASIVIAGNILLALQNRSIASAVDQIGRSQQNYSAYRAALSDGLANYVFTTPVPLTYLLRIAYAFIFPLPIFHPNIDRTWLSIGTVIRFLFIPFLFGGILASLRFRRYWHILAAFFLLFFGVALITFSTRHYVQFLPYAALLTALGYSRYKSYRNIVWLLLIWLGAFLFLMYFASRSLL